MKNAKYLADLITDHGGTFHGSEAPEYVASQWIRVLPEADLSDFHGWFDHGFWAPDVTRALSDAEVFPWEVPADTAYDLCNGDLPVAVFLKARRY